MIPFDYQRAQPGDFLIGPGRGKDEIYLILSKKSSVTKSFRCLTLEGKIKIVTAFGPEYVSEGSAYWRIRRPKK